LPARIGAIDIPQRTKPGVIAITEPMPRRLQHIISAPGIHMHQRDDGRIVLGEQDGAPQNDAHALRLEGRPNNFPIPEIAQQHAARMLAVAEGFTPGIASAQVDHVYIGWRPLPLDGHPVIGASPNRSDVYIAIMHSGVTLAPIVGQLAAHELIEGDAIERLDEYRPDRVFEEIKRY
jgi:glycine/D-amino acid oxidase-like deaminating enzyme